MSMQTSMTHDPRLEFDLADRLRRALRVSDVSVQDMADYLGVSRGAVSTWLNGRITPRKSTLRLFAMRTGFPLEWIESGTVATSPDSPVGPAGIEPTTSTVKAGRLVSFPRRDTLVMRETASAS